MRLMNVSALSVPIRSSIATYRSWRLWASTAGMVGISRSRVTKEERTRPAADGVPDRIAARCDG
jgi:hypothetical protein